MAPSRKSKSVNKRFSNVREAASSKDKIAENASKNKQKASPGTQKVNLFPYFGKKFFFLYMYSVKIRAEVFPLHFILFT